MGGPSPGERSRPSADSWQFKELPTSRTVTWTLGTVNSGSLGSVTLTTRVKWTAAVGSQQINKANFTGDGVVSPPTAVAATVVK